MLRQIINKKERFRDFFAVSARGLQLVWSTGRRLTLINFCLFVLQSIVPLLSLLVLKKVIDGMKSGINWQEASLQLSLFALLQLLGGVFSQFSAYKLAEQQQKISDDIAAMVLTKAVTLDIEYYENPSFYDELHMAQQQSLARPALLMSAYQGIIQNLISIALLSGFMLLAHWSIMLLIVGLSVPLAISKLLHGYQQYLLDRDTLPAQRKANGIFQYLTTDAYAKEVRIFDFGKAFISQFIQLRQHIFGRKKKLHYKFLKQNLFTQLFEVVLTTVIYAVLISSAITGAITLGGLIIYFQVFQRLQAAISGLFQSGINLFQNQLYLRQILEYLSAPVGDTAQHGKHLAKTGAIKVSGLDFTYPLTERKVLRGINMEFKPGTITAIVGENGSGKSTLIKLLCKLYEAERGSIFLGDVPITAVSRAELWERVSVLFQDFGRYYMTVEENIAPGATETDKPRLAGAIKNAELQSKIASLPHDYRTMLGRTFVQGEQLSGGQWQKIALARMFYKEADIVILDEPTSSMDPVAEHAVFQNLRQALGSKIVILVTHRLYNLKMADNIYIMENGGVVEQGGFEQLLAANGPFARIYENQKI